MAISVKELGVELRIIGTVDDDLDAGQEQVVGRMLKTACALISQKTTLVINKDKTLDPENPELQPLVDSALVQLAAYLYDKPASPVGTGWSNAWTNSGAASILARYVSRRAFPIGD